jgi:hypothetical protein
MSKNKYDYPVILGLEEGFTYMGVLKRVEIYPNRKVAKDAFNNRVIKGSRNTPALYPNYLIAHGTDRDYYYFNNIDDLRGHKFDEIYIHPNVKDRDLIIDNCLTFYNCRVVIKI